MHGISIASLTGPNGLLSQADEAKTATNRAGAKEKVEVEVLGSYGTDGNISLDKLNENLQNIPGIKKYKDGKLTELIEDLPVDVEVDGNIFEISDTGIVTEKGTGTLTPEPDKVKEYVTNGLIRHFDAINNTGVGHSDSANIWKDLSGNYNGTINNGAVISENYVNFDGTDDWVNVGQITGKSAITLEATVSANIIQTVDARILCNQESGGVSLSICNNNGFSFVIHVNGAYKSVVQSQEYNVNQKYHLVGTYDGETMKIYVNGQLKNSNSNETQGPIRDPNNNTTMAIGVNPYDNTGQDGYANIKVYSARIYDRALTDSEVLQNYKMDKERFGITE